MTHHTPEDQKRMERRRRSHLLRRTAIVAIVAAVLFVIAAGGYTAWRMQREGAEAPPAELVVIAESELEDGTKVAGAVAVLKRGAEGLVVVPVDTLGPAEIPGTSYDRLREALSLGGADLVAQLAAGTERDDEPGWLLLDEDAWAQLVDRAGGASVELTGSTTVFTGEKLFRFSAGARTLTGDEAVALLRGSETLSGKGAGAAVRDQITRDIVSAAMRDPSATAVMVDSGDAESSEQPEALVAFLR